MKSTTLLIILGFAAYLMYLRSEEKKAAVSTSSSSGSTSGTGGSKTLGDFIDEAANLLKTARDAVAGSSGSDSTNSTVDV